MKIEITYQEIYDGNTLNVVISKINALKLHELPTIYKAMTGSVIFMSSNHELILLSNIPSIDEENGCHVILRVNNVYSKKKFDSIVDLIQGHANRLHDFNHSTITEKTITI